MTSKTQSPSCKRGPGQPPKPAEKKLRHHVATYLNEEQFRQVEAALAPGESLANFIREAALEKAAKS